MSGVDESIRLSWRAHPARTQPGRAGAGGAVILAVGAGVAAVFRADGFPWPNCIGFGLVACAVLVLAANRFYLPSTYTIDDAALTARSFAGTKVIPWKNVRRFLHDSRGGFLSSRARSSWLESMHGVHVLFDADPRRAREAIEAIESHIASARIADYGGAGVPPAEADRP